MKVVSRDRVPEPVIKAGRAVIRQYGMSTAGFRPGPDFLLIGAKRGGSTSLYYTLLEHPQILSLFPRSRFLPKAADTKGVHFFDSHYAEGQTWYRSHFPTAKARQAIARRTGGPALVGEGSPYYLFHPLAAERAGRDVPEAKLLLCLRDPVERAFSHYRERRRGHFEELDTFEDALAAEPDRLAGEEERIRREPRYRSYAHEQQSYRAQSEYAPALRRWLEHFPAEQLHVLAAEDFYQDQQRACDGIFTFLGLPSAPLHSPKVLNAAPSQELKDSTRQQLAEHYAPFNADLESLLGRTFPWTRP